MGRLNTLIVTLSIITIMNISGSNPTADSCRPFVNSKAIQKQTMSFEEEIDCMKAGHKKTLLYEEKDDLDNNRKTLVTTDGLLLLTVPRFDLNDDPFRYIIYTKEKFKEALLLKKYFLEDSLNKYLENTLSYKMPPKYVHTAYSRGKLLEYDEEDIKLLYQRRALNDIVNNKKQAYVSEDEKNRIKKSLFDPPAIQRIATEDKHKILWENRLKKDKAVFEAWYKKNNQLSIDQLNDINRQIESIINQLANKSKVKATSKNNPFITTKEKPKDWLSLLKEYRGYIATFAAGAATAYAYVTGSKTRSP